MVKKAVRTVLASVVASVMNWSRVRSGVMHTFLGNIRGFLCRDKGGVLSGGPRGCLGLYLQRSELESGWNHSIAEDAMDIVTGEC